MAKKRTQGSRLRTAAELTAAAVGLASLLYEFLQHRQGLRADDAAQGDDHKAKGEVPRDAHRSVAYRESRRVPEAEQSKPSRASKALRGADTLMDAAQGLIGLNEASPDALRSIRKLSRKHAKRLLSHRPFKSVRDLKQVLPRRVYKAVRNHVTI
jgi:hypothetical protein